MKTCIHHNDDERAAARCPVCLGRELAALRADNAAYAAELTPVQVALGKCHPSGRGTLAEQVCDIAESAENYRRALQQAEAEKAALRAALDPERIIAGIELPGGHYCDPQAVADAIREYCRAALACQSARGHKLAKDGLDCWVEETTLKLRA